MTYPEQLGLLPERGDERRPSLHRAQVPAGAVSEFGTAWCFRYPQMHSTVLSSRAQARYSLINRERCACTASGGSCVQCLEKLYNLRKFGRAGKEAEVEARETDSGGNRQLFSGEAVVQDRCLAPRGPGPCEAESLGQTRFENENNYSTLPRFLAAVDLIACSHCANIGSHSTPKEERCCR
jgi:hypothetical protein